MFLKITYKQKISLIPNCLSAQAANAGSVIFCFGKLPIRSFILHKNCGPIFARTICLKRFMIFKTGREDLERPVNSYTVNKQ